MTWGMLGDTLRGLRMFVEMWEFVEFDFIVIDRMLGDIVGTGRLKRGLDGSVRVG